jgi:hypothetical protein
MLTYRTIKDEITFGPEILHTQTVMALRLNGKLIADFEICFVWDEIRNALIKLSPHNSPGIMRRRYEAVNVERLTEEYLQLLEKQEKVKKATEKKEKEKEKGKGKRKECKPKRKSSRVSK